VRHGQFGEVDDVGRLSAADQRRKADYTAKEGGQGDRVDRGK
jgi:hypothetical protein